MMIVCIFFLTGERKKNVSGASGEGDLGEESERGCGRRRVGRRSRLAADEPHQREILQRAQGKPARKGFHFATSHSQYRFTQRLPGQPTIRNPH